MVTEPDAGDGLREALGAHQRQIDAGGSCICGEWPRPARDVDWLGHLIDQIAPFLAEHPATPDDGSCCAEMTPHTRTSTPRGPDFCQECSAAVGDWVQWPCPATPATPAEVETLPDPGPGRRWVVVDDVPFLSPAEPDAGDVALTLAERMELARAQVESIKTERSIHVVQAVERIVAAREREVAERIAKAIEARHPDAAAGSPVSYRAALALAARIARAEARP